MTSRLKSAEITGSCAQVWNGVIIPSNGVISVKIDGNNLNATVKSGLEKKDSRTRIQNVDCFVYEGFARVVSAICYEGYGFGG